MKTKASVSAHSDSNSKVENIDRMKVLEIQVASMARKLAALERNGNAHYDGTSFFDETAEASALTDRRSMLKRVGALAAGVAAVGLLRPSSSSAAKERANNPNATGDPMITGRYNSPTNPGDTTYLATPGNVIFPELWHVENASESFVPPAGSLIASSSFISNLGGTPTSGTFYGLYAQARTPAGGTAIGVFGTGTDIGLWGSGGALGGAFSGNRAALALNTGPGGAVPNPNVTDPLGGPGDVYRGSTNGSLWYRTGGLGSYRRLADDTTAGALTLLAVAVRYVDTRNGTGDPGGAFSPGEVRTYNFTTLSPGTIPVGARGIVGNIAAVDPNTTGNLQIDPTGIFADGSAAVLNFNPGQDISNHFVTALAANGDLSVKANPNGGSVQLVIDIYGYYL
jgi:hypothetical protein